MKLFKFSVMVVVAAAGCGGEYADPSVNPSSLTEAASTCTPWTNIFDSNPRDICHVSCRSNDSTSDVTATISQTAPRSGKFTAHVVQTRPVAINISFSKVNATWSGHFFNFDDQTSALPEKFHLLTRGMNAPDLDNVEVYTTDSSKGPVNSGIICAMTKN